MGAGQIDVVVGRAAMLVDDVDRDQFDREGEDLHLAAAIVDDVDGRAPVIEEGSRGD